MDDMAPRGLYESKNQYRMRFAITALVPVFFFFMLSPVILALFKYDFQTTDLLSMLPLLFSAAAFFFLLFLAARMWITGAVMGEIQTSVAGKRNLYGNAHLVITLHDKEYSLRNAGHLEEKLPPGTKVRLLVDCNGEVYSLTWE